MEKNTSCEPMDIDLSSNSISAMDISYNENNSSNMVNEVVPKMPSNFKKLEVKLIKKESKALYRNSYINIVGITVLLISAIMYQFNITCTKININSLKSNFTTRIYGQDIATAQIVKTLELDLNTKMMVLYGGTGVGKTLAVSLMLEDILSYGNVYHYTMPSFENSLSSNILFGLTWCKSSIIAIDDIKQSDILSIKETVKYLITKAQNLNKNLTLILVYNCDIVDNDFSFKCDSSFESDLKQNFSDINVPKSFIKFKNLDNTVLRKCIEYELGKKISENVFNSILNNFDVSRNGCKGVHKKMKYLNMT